MRCESSADVMPESGQISNIGQADEPLIIDLHIVLAGIGDPLQRDRKAVARTQKGCGTGFGHVRVDAAVRGTAGRERGADRQPSEDQGETPQESHLWAQSCKAVVKRKPGGCCAGLPVVWHCRGDLCPCLEFAPGRGARASAGAAAGRLPGR